MFSYPVHASDYLDKSGWNGHGSVAGIISDDNKIIMGYQWGFTYRQAQKVANFLNAKRPSPELLLTIQPESKGEEGK
jgi:hypothetical protein